MPNSFTTWLNLEKPEVGADANLWGGHVNSDLDIIDSIFTSATTRPISSQILSSTKYLDVTTTSKAMMLAMSSISAGATRTLTVQDSDGTLALLSDITGMATTGEVAAATVGMVDTSSVQTLSNKTLTSPVITTGALGASTSTTLAGTDTSTKVANMASVQAAIAASGGGPIAYAFVTGVGTTMTLVKSFNITSIVNSASTGRYIVTMASAAADTSYRISCTPQRSAGPLNTAMAPEGLDIQARTTTLFGLYFLTDGGAFIDPQGFSLTVWP